MEPKDANKINEGDKVYYYDIKLHPTVECCKVTERFKFYTWDGYRYDNHAMRVKPINSKEKEFVSNVKHLFFTEEEAQAHLEKHIVDNINIYEREIERIKKEQEQKLKTFKDKVKKYKALIRKLKKQKETNKCTTI